MDNLNRVYWTCYRWVQCERVCDGCEGRVCEECVRVVRGLTERECERVCEECLRGWSESVWVGG